jgi:type IV pilus assembly protein PilV
MIEVMVTLFIIAVGLLGVAGLQSAGLRQANDSMSSAQAQILVQDLAEMIIAFDPNADGHYDFSSIPASQGTDCLANICTHTQLAQYNLWEWNQNMQPALPSVDVAIDFNAADRSYEIELTWDADKQGSSYSKPTCDPDDSAKQGCFAMLITI